MADREQFVAFCAAYEKSGLAPGDPPPGLAALCEGMRLLASPAPRARRSALRLAPEGDWLFAPIFREEPMIAPALPGRWPLPLWLAAARGRELWSGGAAAQREALRRRAEQAALMLADHAPCLLVGHGWFNRALGAALIRQGFRADGPAHARGPWSARAYRPA
ncbi:hypothetical protein M2322_002330 [Rhodoblastus acidophilus]|uniref:hypothetical protein n=1 Tax=Rhodoblastus acidophilus TaxID=1074 RepID=UPI002224F088|nr:hypothetical protein [Rhodoblastus acidophilus]MCW2316776.1 hypothetical protein [Rhodoblastus acidophilus]